MIPIGSSPFTEEDLYKLIEHARSFNIVLSGDCFDCGKAIEVVIDINPDDGKYSIVGGAVWKKDESVSAERYGGDKKKMITETTITLKCDDCFQKSNVLHDMPTEVFARVVGYMRPIDGWNKGKKEEFKDRKGFVVKVED